MEEFAVSPVTIARRTAVMSIFWNDFTPDQYPLIWAAADGNETLVVSLLEQGVDIDESDPWNQTALLWALKNGNIAMMKLLLSRGADPEPREFEILTALHKDDYLNKQTQIPCDWTDGSLAVMVALRE